MAFGAGYKKVGHKARRGRKRKNTPIPHSRHRKKGISDPVTRSHVVNARLRRRLGVKGY